MGGDIDAPIFGHLPVLQQGVDLCAYVLGGRRWIYRRGYVWQKKIPWAAWAMGAERACWLRRLLGIEWLRQRWDGDDRAVRRSKYFELRATEVSCKSFRNYSRFLDHSRACPAHRVGYDAAV